MDTFRNSPFLFLLGLLLLTSASEAAVPNALQLEISHLAKEIAGIVNKHGGGSIAVGEFTGSVDIVGHAGPVVQTTLAAELAKQGLQVVTSNHKFEVAGRYQPFQDDHATQGLITVKLVSYLVDQQTGDFLAERPTGRLIFGQETVPGMLGLNRSGPPLRDPVDISRKMEQALHKPQINLHKTRIEGLTGQYALEVIVKKEHDYVPVSVALAKGHPFVDLKESEIYGVRLINNSPYEAAIDLCIDGINCFAFSESNSRYWIVKPHNHLDVLGWPRSDTVVTEFKVVANFPETAAAKLNLKPSSSIGLITAHFSASWEKDPDRPTDEPDPKGRGTGFGDDITFKTKKVNRTIGQVRDNLTLRYER